MWYPTEKRTVLTGQTLPNSSITVIRNVWPLDGSGWAKIRLILRGTLVAGTGTVPNREGVYAHIKGITLRTSRGETLYNNVPGMAMYHYNQFVNHTTPYHDEVVVAGGTFVAVLDLPLSFPFLNRPEDTIFDSGRYSNLELTIATGAAHDVMTTVGTATYAATMDVEVISTLAALSPDGKSKPYAHAYFTAAPNITMATTPFFDLESSLDLGLFGFLIKGLATAHYYAPWDGHAVSDLGDNQLATLTFRDSVRRWLDNILPESFYEEKSEGLIFHSNHIYYAAGLTPYVPHIPGLYFHKFVQNGSINEHYATGKKSLIRIDLTSAVGTDHFDLLTFGMRALR